MRGGREIASYHDKHGPDFASSRRNCEQEVSSKKAKTFLEHGNVLRRHLRTACGNQGGTRLAGFSVDIEVVRVIHDQGGKLDCDDLAFEVLHTSIAKNQRFPPYIIRVHSQLFHLNTRLIITVAKRSYRVNHYQRRITREAYGRSSIPKVVLLPIGVNPTRYPPPVRSSPGPSENQDDAVFIFPRRFSARRRYDCVTTVRLIYYHQ